MEENVGVVAEDLEDNQYKCKLVPDGYRQLKKMAKSLQGISKTTRRFSRKLTRLLSAVDMT